MVRETRRKACMIDLNQHEKRVLNKLSKQKERVPNMEFNVRGISKHTMKKVLMNLHSRNLIIKSANLLDMRQVYIQISDDGKDVLNFQ